MACLASQTPLRCLLREASRSSSLALPLQALPAFLVPSLSQSCLLARSRTRRRHQSTLAEPAKKKAPSAPKSRIGRTPITVPPEVSLRFFDLPEGKIKSRHPDTPNAAVDVTGPLGHITVPLPPYLLAKLDAEGKKINVSVANAEEKHQRAMWGTIRAILQNSLTGVSEGHSIMLRLVGVGYRATVEPTATTVQPTYEGQQFVNLKLGYAHPVELGIPIGVTATTPQPTRILLEGVNKQTVKQFAAEIRRWRKPEPYKGKGIFVGDETIRLKAKKIK